MPISKRMGIVRHVKTTVESHDRLLKRAKRYASMRGSSLRTVIEDALRLLLSSQSAGRKYVLPDLRAGDPGGTDPLEGYSWTELRDEIYGGREAGVRHDFDISGSERFAAVWQIT